MLRLTEIKLPLDHTAEALPALILRTLGIPESDLLGYRVRRRGHDARKPGVIAFVYTLDVEVRDEAALLTKFRGSPHIGPAPDETYRYPVHACPEPGRRASLRWISQVVSNGTGLPVPPFCLPPSQAVPAMSRCAHLNFLA